MLLRLAALVCLLIPGLRAQDCAPYGPTTSNGAWGTTFVQPITAVSYGCPDGCYFLFHLEVNIGPIPNSNPPVLPVPEPPIYMDAYLNNAAVVLGGQVTTPPAFYQWELDVNGPLPCGSEIQLDFYAPQTHGLGYVIWTCGGC